MSFMKDLMALMAKAKEIGVNATHLEFGSEYDLSGVTCKFNTDLGITHVLGRPEGFGMRVFNPSDQMVSVAMLDGNMSVTEAPSGIGKILYKGFEAAYADGVFPDTILVPERLRVEWETHLAKGALVLPRLPVGHEWYPMQHEPTDSDTMSLAINVQDEYHVLMELDA